jgi:dolichyl-phosphate beta-glucosyltransferase
VGVAIIRPRIVPMPFAFVSNPMPVRRRPCDIVIPCYNEERRLDSDALLSFLDANRDIAFTFVDDGSGDQTLELLTTLRKINPRQISVVHLEKNGGKAAAVRAGVLDIQSRHDTKYGPQFFGYFDADGATPWSMIHRLRESLLIHSDSLAAFASRVASPDSDVRRTFSRWLCSRVCSLLIRATLRVGIRDTQCGAKLFRASAATFSWFAKPFTTNWLFDVELLARVLVASEMSRARVREAIREVPVTRWHDVAGSKIRFRDVSRVFRDLWQVRRLLNQATQGDTVPTLPDGDTPFEIEASVARNAPVRHAA